MSTGKRLAKRSILGTRVAAPSGEGLYFTGIIQAVKTCEDPSLANRFSVRFDDNPLNVSEFLDTDLIGPGFKSMTYARLQAGQLVYVTHCQREMAGRVVRHDFDSQDVIITLSDVSTLFYLDGGGCKPQRKTALMIFFLRSSCFFGFINGSNHLLKADTVHIFPPSMKMTSLKSDFYEAEPLNIFTKVNDRRIFNFWQNGDTLN